MNHRATRLVVVLAVLAVLAAVAIAIVVVGARGPRADEPGTATDRVPVAQPGSGSVREPVPEVQWSNPVRGEPDGVTISGSDVATIEFDEVRLLDLATGAAKWRVRLPGLARAQAVFTANRVVVATRDEVVLLDRAGGRRIGAVAFAAPSTS